MFSEIAEEKCVYVVIFTGMCLQVPGRSSQHLGMHPGKNKCTYMVFLCNLNSTSSGCLHMSLFYQ